MVNTFIISDSPRICASLLDYKRLGKQRVEAKQILDTIQNPSGWKNHPVCHLWKDNIDGLKYYINCMIDEWIRRGYKNTMEKYDISFKEEKDILPWFYYNKQIQNSMKAALLRKNPEYYKDILTLDDSDYINHGYIWTKKLTDKQLSQMKNGKFLPLKDICEKFGTGTPPQYRITKEFAQFWVEDKDINPETGREIKVGGTIYNDYMKAAKYYGLI